tara:strand:+ start:651 stop:1706 length:1056 start_codon:yes stop_codon:yes gene_type:complete
MENIAQLKDAITKIENNQGEFYFLTINTKGVQKASVAMNYELVRMLTQKGYTAHIMHQEEDYTEPDWLGEEYTGLSHKCISRNEIQVSASDTVFIPEIYGSVLEQIKTFPCEKIIFCQSYDYIFETLQPGVTWTHYGINRCLTTCESQKAYLESIMPGLSVEVIPFYFPECFEQPKAPKPPVIAIHTREARDTAKIIKTFYVKYPQFRWIAFKDMRNLPRKKFAEALQETCVSVWVDDISGFGTFPLESMMVGNPVIGKLPNLRPDWLNEHNGIWTYEFNKIVDIIGAFIKNWLEDEVPVELYEHTNNTVSTYRKLDTEQILCDYIEKLNKEKLTALNQAENKLLETEPQN